MKQITYFLVLLSFIGYISTADYCTGETSKDACLSHTLSEAEKTAGIEVCCYSKVNGEEDCVGYSNTVAEQMKKAYKKAGATFKCSSNWLNLGFSLVLLVLFF